MSSIYTAEAVKEWQESQRFSCLWISEGIRGNFIRVSLSLVWYHNQTFACFSGVVCEELSSDGGRKTDVKILQGCILWLKYFFDGDVHKLYKSRPKLCPNIFNTGMIYVYDTLQHALSWVPGLLCKTALCMQSLSALSTSSPMPDTRQSDRPVVLLQRCSGTHDAYSLLYATFPQVTFQV